MFSSHRILMKTRKSCVALSVSVLLSACVDAGLMAPTPPPVEEEVLEFLVDGVPYSCRSSSTRIVGSEVVCVTDEPLPAIVVAFTIGVVSSAVVAIVINELGSNPGWLRHAERTCQYTAVREGWENFELELIYDSATGELVEWNCVEVEY